MKLPIRLENAITKLYTAFHEGKLNFFDCTQCAVGNICNGSKDWFEVFQSGSLEYPASINYQNYKGQVKKTIDSTGYSILELQKIEGIFGSKIDGSPDQNYKGLCAVVEYLCELDNIPNVMDYTKFFETENDKPKYELSV